ncbi:MAG: efflux RND transporter periplasmic adaptor subunit [Cytophagaceae bacterium]|jgi:multidrug efflux pump subunit AcrA (membrane-fusion protein)|nr:efflux RND transporter periplasmic adaptor subunit [Cytophagaceae bacterium]
MQKRSKRIRNIVIIAVVAIAAVVIGFMIINSRQHLTDILIKIPVQKGSFVSEVYSTGQLQAENATYIQVPEALSSRRINIFEIKVTEIVDEGTVVKEDDFVASLDHSAVEEILTTATEELEKAVQALQDARIDTNINMSNLRDELLNLNVDVEEKKLVLEQSVYESPAVKRQAQLDLDRSEQNLQQALRNYDLKGHQAKYTVQRALEEVRKQQERIADINNLFDALRIKAPKQGMVIYSLDRFGNKIKVGSTVSRWAPVIAELPDLTSMISKTFINEIDISKVKMGQNVMIGVDAFPEKKFSGKVIAVTNIGQLLPNGDTKVFEVTIKLHGADPELRPAMTTSNVITTDSMPNVLYIPLDAVFKTDSTKFVYAYKRQLVKQIIDTGAENANYVVVHKGLNEGEEILLNEPSNAENLLVEGVEIYNEIQERIQKAAEEETKKKQEAEENAKSDNDLVPDVPPAGQGRPPQGGRGERR